MLKNLIHTSTAALRASSSFSRSGSTNLMSDSGQNWWQRQYQWSTTHWNNLSDHNKRYAKIAGCAAVGGGAFSFGAPAAIPYLMSTFATVVPGIGSFHGVGVATFQSLTAKGFLTATGASLGGAGGWWKTRPDQKKENQSKKN
eukprot:GABV01010833.1.p1 GENE.GABV01010833.1~~GABV01010833.1.p1  ORF type:complete len:143 (+),score=20.74 GABV01010833.1:2-430(+)